MKIKSVSDVITNSSSECFIIKNEDLDKLRLSNDILAKMTRINTIEDLINFQNNSKDWEIKELLEALSIYSLPHYSPRYGNIFSILREFGHTEEEIEAWKKKKQEEADIYNELAIEDYKKDPRILKSLGKSFIWNYGEDWKLMRDLEKKLKKNNIKYKEIPW